MKDSSNLLSSFFLRYYNKHGLVLSNSERINLIDYLKAIAIIFVVLDHIGIASEDSIISCFGIRMAVPIFMILSGYTFAMSYNRKTFKEMYEWDFLKGKLSRFGIPAVVTCIAIWFVNHKEKPVLRMLIWGEYGPGSYYPGLMLQLLLIFPLLLKIVGGRQKVKLFVVVAVNILWEVSAWILPINAEVYRVLIFRYITYIALGIFLYYGVEFSTWHLIVSFVCGVIYIYSVGMIGYQPYIFRNWSDTAVPVTLYIFPIIYVLFQKFKNYKLLCTIVDNVLTIIGKSSYHILFAQLFTRIIWMNYGNIEFYSVISIRVVGSVIIGIFMWKCEIIGKHFINCVIQYGENLWNKPANK